MDDADLLQVFDTQIRRRPESLPGFQAELVDDPAPMLRMTPTGEDAAWGGGVFWCDLDESTADAAIAAALEWFGPRGRQFECRRRGRRRARPARCGPAARGDHGAPAARRP
jgi:hypothetical protein